jgi:UDP-glucose 4-epimerase
MIDAVRQIEALAGRTAVVSHSSERLGDQRHAVADVSKIRNHLGWELHIRFEEGILRQWQWQTAAPADAIEPKSAIVSRSATLRSKTTVSAGPRA